MDKDIELIVDKSLLYDFYGELLTAHQQSVYERAVFEDLSLSEIAEEEGISRQGVHDLLKRCDKLLSDYESKLHLVEKFKATQKEVEKIHELAKEYLDGDKSKDSIEIVKKIELLASSMLEEL